MTNKEYILKNVIIYYEEISKKVRHKEKFFTDFTYFFRTLNENNISIFLIFNDKKYEVTTDNEIKELKRDIDFKYDDSIIISANRQNIDNWVEKNFSVIEFIGDKNMEEDFSKAKVAITKFDGIDYSFLKKHFGRHFNLPWEVLETDRLIIRELEIADIDRLYEIYNDDDIVRYTESLFEDKDMEIEYLKGYIENIYKFFDLGIWGIVLKDENLLIGRAGIDVKADDKGESIYEIGYLIDKKYQQQGYAYESCLAIINYCFENTGIEKIICIIEKENIASLKLAKKLGFQFEDFIEKDGKLLERYIIVKE
ncbi:Protein N-acetyltransferase, RimJ/RimL family [Acetitomaculum ruminis DSM 5522]|uniref:Protein N-acetyltransferase, RimJ/RimL family n=1 Tax=Acetitomaculum ruminis DSM 5522 TaxID=1120918 RepID=A0A1I1AHT7_9FIRM|nr:GNAT family N-acetyltransferase [Acetitomaculum ruminis]SFB36030.1 Protein N-acetyltransferase, RimJ/RimL family [Acetitomaculum ruminis DSM 5522]